jgi:hypothetical protein
LRRTLDDNLEIISAYSDDIVLILIKNKGKLNRVIKMVETVLCELNLKVNKNNSELWKLIQKSSKKPENKEAERIKFLNQY